MINSHCHPRRCPRPSMYSSPAARGAPMTCATKILSDQNHTAQIGPHWTFQSCKGQRPPRHVPQGQSTCQPSDFLTQSTVSGGH